MDQQLLSDLCTICHTEKPKYRCPRCRAQTCSLQCYKRHQQRASCSGKRDPAAYVKKSQWATPTGIDRDYNYLKGVERTVHDAHQNVSQRDIGGDHSKSKVTLRAWRPDGALQRYLSDNRITVEHAPTGMSKQKNNHTRTTKNHNVFWTIEWAEIDKRTTQHDCPGSQSLLELYTLFQVQSRNAEKRRLRVEKPEPSKRGSKRKRKASSQHSSRPEEETRQSLKVEEQVGIGDAKEPTLDHTRDSDRLEEQLDQDRKDIERADEHSDDSASSVHFILNKYDDEEPIPSMVEHATSVDGPSHSTHDIKSENHYYLLKPSTVGQSNVLIPLDSHSSLTTALCEQTVQEYPTIYVFEHAPSDLPNGFQLESEYLEMEKRTNRITTDSAVKHERGGTVAGAQNSAAAQTMQEVDASSILEMLRRDITR